MSAPAPVSRAATLRAYERWAPLYPPTAHNPLMRIEEQAMRAAWPSVHGHMVLDLACGSGRYSRLLEEGRPRRLVALDFCMPMLERTTAGLRVCADMARLPFRDGSFGAIVCGLAIGHCADLAAWMLEMSRVLEAGGVLLYSDFHGEAARAGLIRAFTDESGSQCIVPHETHALAAHLAAARAAGLEVELVRELRVGVELVENFPKSARFYARWPGLPLVLVLRVRKAG
jgi:ubiquinone/menaquinone biosynthesis C-methylase UbiE